MPSPFFSSYTFNSIKINRGFLPSENPTHILPEIDPLTQTLNYTIQHLPELIKTKQFRLEMDRLNCLYKNKLLNLASLNQREKNLAMLILTMLSQAYVWETPKQPATIIPRFISTNLTALGHNLSRLPALSYQDYVLNNWRLKNPDCGITLDNIDPLFTFTGSRDEAWFIIIHVVMEKLSSDALRAALQAVNLANHDQLDPLGSLFQKISNSLAQALKIFKQLKEQCEPDYFFNTMRLYLKGWEEIKSIDNGKEVLGVCFDLDSESEKKYLDFRGPSGAQSSIIPALDAAMGIKHPTEPVLKIFKQYMPQEHQSFIHFMTSSQLKEKVMASQRSDLIEGYTDVIQHIFAFRNKHSILVKDFLITPASKLGIVPHQIIGTGGEPVDEYLEKRIEQTQHTLTHLGKKQIAPINNTARMARL